MFMKSDDYRRKQVKRDEAELALNRIDKSN
jgi:hypothetical protein